MLSEHELILKSQAGDKAAFDLLVRRYSEKIKHLSQSVCRGLPAEADDVFQDTFLKALEKIGQFKGRSSLGTWLYRVAANLCWKRKRAHRRKPAVSLSELSEMGKEIGLAGPAHIPDKKLEEEEWRKIIGGALEDLPSDFRSVLLLGDLDGYSNRRIAARLGLSLSAVKSRLHRARALVRKNLLKHFRS